MERGAQDMVLKRLRPEMFYVSAHQAVFRAVAALYGRGEGVDMLTVTEEMRRSGTLDEAGGAYRVAMLAGRVASAAHIEYHCLILQQYYLRRRLVQVLSEQLKAAGDMTNDVYDVVIAVQREIAALLDDSEVEDHLHDMPEVMDRTVREVERRQALSVGGLTGVPTGLAELDALTGGWQPGNLIFTAARPGDGKTAIDLFLPAKRRWRGCPWRFSPLR